MVVYFSVIIYKENLNEFYRATAFPEPKMKKIRF